jgi:hypothetical protein
LPARLKPCPFTKHSAVCDLPYSPWSSLLRVHHQSRNANVLSRPKSTCPMAAGRVRPRMYPKTKSKRVQSRKNQATDLPVMERLATEILSDKLAGRGSFCWCAHDDWVCGDTDEAVLFQLRAATGGRSANACGKVHRSFASLRMTSHFMRRSLTAWPKPCPFTSAR